MKGVVYMTITEVSEKYGLTPDTLRYYERIGLIPPVHRNKSGIRDYTEENVRWVEFAKCMRGAGLSIETLVEYVSLFQMGEETFEARRMLLKEERVKLVEKIENMQQTLERLDYKIARYDDRVKEAEKKLIGDN